MLQLKTKRLRLMALSLEQLDFFLISPHELEQELELALTPNTTQDPAALRAISTKIGKMRRARRPDHPWYTYWLLAVPEIRCGAGLAGFKGIPDQKGEAEIGYGIDPAFRNRGYMSEAVHALVSWAFEAEACRAVVARKVLRTNIASQRVLEKVGMHIYEESTDAQSWRVEKAAPPLTPVEKRPL